MDKAAFRSIIKQRKPCIGHRVLDSAIIARLKERICALQKQHAKKTHAPFNVLLYYPLRNEVDIRPLLESLRKDKNIHLFMPFMVGISLKMVSYRMPLSIKAFGIKEPPFSSFMPKTIHIAVIPMLGVDRRLRRIGYGKGMYDRFFATLSKKPKIFLIARELCYARCVLTDSYDIQADEIFTYNGHIERGTYDRLDKFIALPYLRTYRGYWHLFH